MRTNYIECSDNIKGLRCLPEACIDLTVTSPPYDNLRSYNGFSWDPDGLIAELYRVTKPGGVVVWIVADATVDGSETGTSFRQALAFKEAGFNIHDTMIWAKPGFTAVGTLKTRYASTFEYMFVFSKGKPKTFNPIKDRKNIYGGTVLSGTIRQKDGSTRRMSSEGKILAEYGIRFNVWTMSSERRVKTGHPAPFPEALAQDHIISWSNPGDVVLDPFMGSGTTAAASLKTGRKYIGFEISEEYCHIARQRVADVVDDILEAEA